MKILAADTATPSCSVAILDDDTIRMEISVNMAKTHARSLMPIIDHTLQVSDLPLSAIDAFAVTTGPGSFTGLRIGIATLKGLASATDRPLAGVSTLDALASQFTGASILICPLIDARKKEVYFGRYRWKNGCFAADAPAVVQSPQKVVEGLREPCIFVGDGALKYEQLIRERMGSLACFATVDQHIIRAGRVAHLARRKISGSAADQSEAASPQYIRPSDAEKNLSGKPKDTPVFIDKISSI